MSASEKLRALDKDAQYWPLISALPQIVAVVEAADALPEFFFSEGRTHSFVPLLDDLERALCREVDEA